MGLWEDFTDKYGFGDGGMLEQRDFTARDNLVRSLNEQPEMKAASIRALPFDRDGVHNSCLIIFAKAQDGKTDEELLSLAIESDEPEPELPEMEADIGELIAEAYSAA